MSKGWINAQGRRREKTQATDEMRKEKRHPKERDMTGKQRNRRGEQTREGRWDRSLEKPLWDELRTNGDQEENKSMWDPNIRSGSLPSLFCLVSHFTSFPRFVLSYSHFFVPYLLLLLKFPYRLLLLVTLGLDKSCRSGSLCLLRRRG